jgi:excinuclease ABC subunit C
VHHEIGQCLAPCASLISKEDYHQLIEKVISSSAGGIRRWRRTRRPDEEAAAAMNYERAAIYRDRIYAVRQVMQRQKATTVRDVDQDVVAVSPRARTRWRRSCRWGRKAHRRGALPASPRGR